MSKKMLAWNIILSVVAMFALVDCLILERGYHDLAVRVNEYQVTINNHADGIEANVERMNEIAERVNEHSAAIIEIIEYLEQ